MKTLFLRPLAQYANNNLRYTHAHLMKHVLRVVGLLTLTAGAFGFGGCSVLDPAEEIPSYVRINSIGVQINNSQIEGTGSQKITDAWLYVDGELIGAFEMPVSIPVLAEGAHTLLVFAGIKQNGLSTLRAIYPKYKAWEGTVTLVRGEIVNISPVVQYFPATNFVWMCDFDGPGTNIDDSDGPWPGRLQEISGPNAFEGESGYVTLTSDTNEFYAQSSLSYQLNNQYDVYLEMNYKCNQAFVIGMKNSVNGSFIPWCEVQPSTGWNKIYIRLNDAINTQPPGGQFHIYIAMQKNPDIALPELYFDELKLIN
jgi:hypothetical protein